MIEAHGVDAVRRAEAAAMAGLPDGALMQRAAAGLARTVAAELRTRTGGVYGRRVAMLVGAGSNGGDALWAGVRLAGRGAVVCAVLTSPQVHGQGLAALRAAGGKVVDATPDEGRAGARLVLDSADAVVDGLLGIGGRPGLTGVAAELVSSLAPGPRPGPGTVEGPDRGQGHRPVVVAVDLPSGVHPNTGEVSGVAVRADVTVTFGTVKPCLLLPPANALAGRVVAVDIGLDGGQMGPPAVTRLEQGDVRGRWPVPRAGDDKYSRGVVGVVAGGATYTGAAVLCAGAAVRSGAGMVRYLGPAPAADLVRASWPEVVPGPGRVQAWVLGPGVDPDDHDQVGQVRAALDGDVPCLVDAGALLVLADVLARGRRPAAPLLLTPHSGELARLLSALTGDVSDPGAGMPYEGLTRQQVEARPVHHAQAAAESTGAAVLLKGATTLVVAPDGRVRAQPDGPHWLATAGSGDVLTGIAGVLLAAGLEPLEAGSLAVAVHGRAGQEASQGGPISAGSLLDAVPAAVAGLLAAGSAEGFATLAR